VDFVRNWSEKTEIAADRLVGWIGIARGKFYEWRKRYGRANEHNGRVPRDHWLTDEERREIIAFHERFPLEGYRRLTFMMIDQDVVAASPSSVYRVLAAPVCSIVGTRNFRKRAQASFSLSARMSIGISMCRI
jgi:hypothetical protein